jgi:hypothetical protein
MTTYKKLLNDSATVTGRLPAPVMVRRIIALLTVGIKGWDKNENGLRCLELISELNNLEALQLAAKAELEAIDTQGDKS